MVRLIDRYALAWREQQQLFLLDKTYLTATLCKVGGLAALIGQFLVQFFHDPTVAVILTAVLLAVLSGLLWMAVKRGGKDWAMLPLCLVPAFLWAASLADQAMHFDGLVASLFAAGALAAYARISRNRLLWGCLLTVLLFLASGPAALLFAVCAWILDLFRPGRPGLRSGIYVLVTLLCAALALLTASLPTWGAALTPALFYDIDAPLPASHWWAWLSMPAVILLSVVMQERIRKPSLMLGAGILLALLSLIPSSIVRTRLEAKEPLPIYEFEHYVAREDWDGLITACRRNDWTPGTANYLNLALARKGRLNDDLMKYDQRGVQSLITLSKDKSMDVRIARVMDGMGNVAAAQDVAFNLLFSSVGYCPEMMKTNVKAELIRGSYAVADKYLSLLEKAPHYKEWARHYRRFRWDDGAVEDDPELGAGRMALPEEDGFALFESPLTELDRIIAANPDHPGAMQYALAFRLLAKDIEGLTRFVDRYYGAQTLRTLPVPVQEALIFYSDYSRNFEGVEPVNLEWCLSHGVTQETIRRFVAFQEESIRQGGAAPQGSQRTFWYYLLYKQI